MKKLNYIIIGGISLILGLILSILIFDYKNNLEKLPLPEVTSGQRGTLGIDKNINEETIDNYIGRSDSVYYDMRMLKDPGNYEAIGGDSYLSGIIKGFEVLPYPYITEVKGLPEAVGDSYKGVTLFREENGKYIENYKESLEILEYFFPKDKNIFLMCGGGGYAGMTKNLLISLGWDKNKIYNVGGYWYYNGKNNINIKRITDNKTTYDFWKLTYHNIDFNLLTKVN